jgi:hypothetical protein
MIVTVPNLTTTNVLSYMTASGGTCPVPAAQGATIPSASAIVAVCLDLQTSKVKQGQAGGYQTAAFSLAPAYDGSIG